MPAAKKPTSSTTTRRTRRTQAEPVAHKRLNKSLDDAQKALVALRKDVGKDVSQGARDLYTDLNKFVKDARRLRFANDEKLDFGPGSTRA
jgi:hypothetical protein